MSRRRLRYCRHTLGSRRGWLRCLTAPERRQPARCCTRCELSLAAKPAAAPRPSASGGFARSFPPGAQLTRVYCLATQRIYPHANASAYTRSTDPRSMSRQKHKVKELEALLAEAESKGWRVDKKTLYFRLRCPCGKHMTWVHLTPSNPKYEQEKRQKLQGTGCW